jgi:uncharacterized protein YjbI with pentapeptide repeats
MKRLVGLLAVLAVLAAFSSAHTPGVRAGDSGDEGGGGATFLGVPYIYANPGVSQASLSNADLAGASLKGTNLKGDDLTGANATGANFSGANLSQATLNGANLTNANFSGANLSGVTVTGAVVTGAQGLVIGGVPAPSISSFTAAAPTITAGSHTTLTAVYSSGTGSIDNGVGAVTSGSPVTVSPATTTTYTLTITGPAGDLTTATATVTVGAGSIPAATTTVPSKPASSVASKVCPIDPNQVGASLPGANLSGCNLVDFAFTGANLAGANLANANISSTTLGPSGVTGPITLTLLFTDAFCSNSSPCTAPCGPATSVPPPNTIVTMPEPLAGGYSIVACQGGAVGLGWMYFPTLVGVAKANPNSSDAANNTIMHAVLNATADFQSGNHAQGCADLTALGTLVDGYLAKGQISADEHYQILNGITTDTITGLASSGLFRWEADKSC